MDDFCLHVHKKRLAEGVLRKVIDVVGAEAVKEPGESVVKHRVIKKHRLTF